MAASPPTGSLPVSVESTDAVVDISQSVRRLQQRIAVLQRGLRPSDDVRDRYRIRPRGHDTPDYVFRVTAGARDLANRYPQFYGFLQKIFFWSITK